jgi:hypothetical protein
LGGIIEKDEDIGKQHRPLTVATGKKAADGMICKIAQKNV